MNAILDPILGLIALGGPVVAVLGVMSVGSLATVLWKLWQFRKAGVGRRRGLDAALADWDAGATGRAATALGLERSYLAPVVRAAIAAGQGPEQAARVDAEAEAALGSLERGFRLLDSIAQTAPLLGLFGTVLGMIDAFRSLQTAGAAVDPSILAGGIWVALLTTAVGLGVAMPTGLALTWFEARVAAERMWTERALARIRAPGMAGQVRSAPHAVVAAHGG